MATTRALYLSTAFGLIEVVAIRNNAGDIRVGNEDIGYLNVGQHLTIAAINRADQRKIERFGESALHVTAMHLAD